MWFGPPANKAGCFGGTAGHRGTQGYPDTQALVWVKGARGADLNAEVHKGMNQGYSKDVVWELRLKFSLGRHFLLLPLNRIAACGGRNVEQASTKQHQEPWAHGLGHILPHFKSWKWLVNTIWILNTVGFFFLQKWESVWNCPGRTWWFTKSSAVIKHQALLWASCIPIFSCLVMRCFLQGTLTPFIVQNGFHKAEKRDRGGTCNL